MQWEIHHLGMLPMGLKIVYQCVLYTQYISVFTYGSKLHSKLIVITLMSQHHKLHTAWVCGFKLRKFIWVHFHHDLLSTVTPIDSMVHHSDAQEWQSFIKKSVWYHDKEEREYYLRCVHSWAFSHEQSWPVKSQTHVNVLRKYLGLN